MTERFPRQQWRGGWRSPTGRGHRRPSSYRVSTVFSAVVLAVLLGGLPGVVAAQPAPPIQPVDPSQATDPMSPVEAIGSLYFAETGHNLTDPFRARWEALGGEAIFGPPQSEERYAEGAGGVLQTFSGITLVFDPTQAAPLDIRGQALAPEVRDAIAPASARQPVAGCGASDGLDCRFFAETGHTLAGNLALFWASYGADAIFGLPVSEPFRDAASDGVTTQVFQRAILEESEAIGVRLRPLGEEEAVASAMVDPAFQPAPPTAGTAFLVGADDGLRLRSGPSMDAEMVALLPENAEFIAATPWEGGWVPGYADGYAGWVAADFLLEAPPLPALDLADWNPLVWQGASLGETNIRVEPSTRARVIEELQYGDPVTVTAWVAGEEVYKGADLWAKLDDGGYVYARNIGRNAPVAPLPPPADAPTFGKWIDINLTQQLITAYDGQTPVRTVETTTGMAGWETPPGFYQILSRVGNETMTSGAIGAEHHYKLEDVLFTQYFTDRGHALHFAWWRTEETIGRPGSHGCINLLLDDARFFWDWATIGTPIYIHA
ncbi:MAG: L,D-transpeptidase family protein [Chloroflexota bacterium]|nr:L,D-transpeptidase family protein [Chloroflexota bacterium]